MSILHYKSAIDLMSENGIESLVKVPSSAGDVRRLEERLGHSLPPSYKAMLSDYGILSFEGRMIYGLGRAGMDVASVPNVVFATETLRQGGEIDDKMVRIMASGYGPFYVIDCEYVDQDGESPVFLVDQLGYSVSRERVANSFGEFLLTEMKECIK